MALENIIRFSTASPGCQDVTRKVSRVSLHLKSRRKHATRIAGRPTAGKVQVENEPGMGRPSTADHKERLQEHSLVLDVAHGGVNEAGTAVAAVKPGEALIGGSEASREQEAAMRSGTPGNGEKRVLSPDPDRNPTPEFVPEDWWIELACDFWQVDEEEVLRIIGRERHEGATAKVTNDQVSGESIPPMVTADLHIPASEDRSSFHNQGLTARPRRRVGGKVIPNIHEFDRLPTIAEETGFVPEDWWVELACEFWQVDEDEVMRIVRGMGCDAADDMAADHEVSGDFIPPIRNADLNGAANESEQSCQNQTPPSRTRRRVGGKLVPNIHEFDRLPTIPEEPSETPETGNRNEKPNKKAKAKRNKRLIYSNASGNEDVSCDKEAIARTDQQGCGSAMEALPRKPDGTAASDLCGPGEAVVGDKTGEEIEMGEGGSGGSRDETRERRVSPVASDSFQATEKSRMINGKAKTTKKTATRQDPQGKRAAQSGASPSRTCGRQSPVTSGDTTRRLPSLTNPGQSNTREKSQHFIPGMLKVCDFTHSQIFITSSTSSKEGGSELRLPRLDATRSRKVQLTFHPKPPPRPAPEERTNPRARRLLKFAEPSAPEQQSVKEVELTERVGGNWPRPPGVSSSGGSGASPTKPGLLPELPRRGGHHVSACATEKISDCTAPKSAKRKLSAELNVRRFTREADHENRCARPLQQPRAPEENLPRPPAVPRFPTEKSRTRLNAVHKAGKVKILQDEADKQNREVCCY